MRSLLAVLLGFSTFIAASSAAATPNFPAALQKHIQAKSVPDCSLCHNGPTQRGTVTTPFGASMRSRGLVADDEGSLRTALDALRAEKKDSDRDGVTDIDELVAGTDPNAGSADGGPAPLVPEYGCAVRPGATTPAHFLLGLGTLVMLVVAARLRRRPPRGA